MLRKQKKIKLVLSNLQNENKTVYYLSVINFRHITDKLALEGLTKKKNKSILHNMYNYVFVRPEL